MRLRLFMLLVCLMAARAAEAQTYLWFEPQGTLERVEDETKTGEYFGNLSFGHQWKPWLGVFIQSAHGNLWGETAAGPSFQLNDEFNFGVGIGIEHFAPKPLRLRLNAYYDDAQTGSFAYFQYDVGNDSSWIWADATRMHKWFGLGVLLQMPDAGVGPKLEVRAGKHVGIWVAPVYDWQAEVVRTLVGGRLMWDRE